MIKGIFVMFVEYDNLVGVVDDLNLIDFKWCLIDGECIYFFFLFIGESIIVC